jgi:hypothetical protein
MADALLPFPLLSPLRPGHGKDPVEICMAESVNLLAARTDATGIGVPRAFAVQELGEGEGGGGFAHSAGPVKEIGMRDLAAPGGGAEPRVDGALTLDAKGGARDCGGPGGDAAEANP